MCCIAHRKKKNADLRSNRQLEAPVPLIFLCRIFRNSALAPKLSIDPLFGKADIGSMVHSREWQSDSSFRVLLPGGPHR